MNPFEVEFFRAPFLEQGAAIGSEKEQKRIRAYVADLTRLTPRLQRLRTSTVTTQIEHTESGLALRFFLREIKQRDLFSSTYRAPLGSSRDEFEQEVQEVQSETERLIPLLEQAMSPGVTPVRLRIDDPLARQMRAARELILKRQGMHVLSGYKKPKNYSTALFFPVGTLAQISARVSSLSAGLARLRDVVFSGDIPHPLGNVRFHRSVQMNRPMLEEAKDVTIKLHRIMESDAMVTMEVLILWDAVTGQPRELDFQRFCD